MKIFKLASPDYYLHEFPDESPEFDEYTEAIRLKDGRIFFNRSINHWHIIKLLKERNIHTNQFDAIGWIGNDGVWTTKVQGDNDIQNI